MTSGLGTAAIIHYQLIIIIINDYDNDNNNNKCFGDWGLYTKLFRFLLLIGMDTWQHWYPCHFSFVFVCNV